MVIVTYDEFGGQWDHVPPPGQAGNPGPHDLPLPLGRRVVQVEVQAPAPQRLGQVPRAVRGQEDRGHLPAGHRAELGDRDLVVRQHLEQQRLGLDIEPVDLVDQQDHRLGRPDRVEQRPGQQELLGEDACFRPVPGAADLAGQQPEQLLGVVPLVQRPGLVDALVALQAHQP